MLYVEAICQGQRSHLADSAIAWQIKVVAVAKKRMMGGALWIKDKSQYMLNYLSSLRMDFLAANVNTKNKLVVPVLARTRRAQPQEPPSLDSSGLS